VSPVVQAPAQRNDLRPVRLLAAKELHVHRFTVAGGTLAGIASVLVATRGDLGFRIGALGWLTAVIAVGAMLAFAGVHQERRDNTRLFVFSLPLSPRGYVLAKLLGLLACFAIPWAVSSAAALLLVAFAPGIPRGLLPYTVLLCGFLLANFSLALCGALQARSERLMTATILVTNMAVSVYLFTIPAIPGIGDHLRGDAVVWNLPFLAVLGAELLVLAAALTLPLLTVARRRDHL
jgi:ABC-2 type transport system permease protein